MQHLSLYPYVAIDMYAVGHFIYHSLTKRMASGNNKTADLEQINFPNANTKKSGNVYVRLALELIQTAESFLLTKDTQVFALFDNAVSKDQARSLISENYKSNRSKMPATFYRTMDFVQFYLSKGSHPNMKVCRVPQREADDLIKIILAHQNEEEGLVHLDENKRMLLVSPDSDWHACLGYNADMWWFTLPHDEVYNVKSFMNEYGFEPDFYSVAVYKALMGDKADNIAPVLRHRDIDHETLIHIIRTYATEETSESLPAKVSTDPKVPNEVKALIKERRPEYHVNLKLTSTLPVSLSRLKKNLWEGDNNSSLRGVIDKALMSALENTPPVKKFNFGGIAANV